LIPLKDTIPSKTYPVVNWFLILANLAVFIYAFYYLDDKSQEGFILTYGLVPDSVKLTDVSSIYELRISVIRPFFSNIFLHGGWGHLISNMWSLYIFGDNVEDRMGKLKYFFFYICCGFAASITHFILYRYSGVPAIGASGAIYCLMAAYMVMFPRSTILSLVPVLIIPLFIPIPALIYIGIWFVAQLLSGTTSLMSGTATGIAFWAHIGGFIGGLLLVRVMVSGKRRTHYS
jgi:membrane associated rhomboid family serine protease